MNVAARFSSRTRPFEPTGLHQVLNCLENIGEPSPPGPRIPIELQVGTIATKCLVQPNQVLHRQPPCWKNVLKVEIRFIPKPPAEHADPVTQFAVTTGRQATALAIPEHEGYCSCRRKCLLADGHPRPNRSPPVVHQYRALATVDTRQIAEHLRVAPTRYRNFRQRAAPTANGSRARSRTKCTLNLGKTVRRQKIVVVDEDQHVTPRLPEGHHPSVPQTQRLLPHNPYRKWKRSAQLRFSDGLRRGIVDDQQLNRTFRGPLLRNLSEASREDGHIRREDTRFSRRWEQI